MGRVSEATGEGGISYDIADKAGEIIARWPARMLACCCLVIILMVGSVVGLGGAALSDDGTKDWEILDSKVVEQDDAIVLAERDADCLPLPNGECPTFQERDKPDVGFFGVFLMYESEASAEGVFTPENLQKMCNIEELFMTTKGYPDVCLLKPGRGQTVRNSTGGSFTREDCQPQHSSIVQQFYSAAGRDVEGCELLNGTEVAAESKRLHDGLGNEATFAKVGFHLGNDVVSGITYNGGRTLLARSALALGHPLVDPETGTAMGGPQQLIAYSELFYQEFEKNFYGYFGYEVKSALSNKFSVGKLEVSFYGMSLMSEELNRLVTADIGFALFAIIFTGFYLTFHTQSAFVGILSMFQILMSLYLALFFYRFIFGVTYFSQLHTLLVFVILGIGADDVFVFNDAWHDFEHSPQGQKTKHLETTERLRARLAFAYRHAMMAVLSTSITTSCAFVATSVSPLMPMKSMGYFGALLVLGNYILVITFTPCVFATLETYNIRCPCWRWCKTKEQPAAPEEQKADVEGANAPPDEDANIPKVLKVMIPILKRRPVAICLAVLLLAWAITNMACAAQLAPPVEALKWFPDDHMIERSAVKMKSGYAASGADEYNVLTVAFGIEGVDREVDPGIDKWIPHKWFGVPVYDGTFNLTTSASQDFLRGFCERLHAAKCDAEGCKPFGTLIQPSNESMSCFMQEFHDAQGGATHEGAAFVERLKTFRAQTTPAAAVGGAGTWEKLIGFSSGDVRYVQVKAVMTLKKEQIDAIKEPIFDVLEAFLNQEKANAPAGMKSIMPSVPIEWSMLVTSKAIVSGMWTGFAICFPVAFLVLMFATNNIILAFLAIITIMMVVGNVLGYCWMAGWSLGITESIAAVIVIGLSVDYVIHLGHMYLEAWHDEGALVRDKRWEYAMRKMGGTVIAGAVTTFFSGIVMQFCTIVFFNQMSTLIVMTIVNSIIYAMFFFMSVLLLFGPEYSQGDISGCFRFLKNRVKRCYRGSP